VTVQSEREAVYSDQYKLSWSVRSLSPIISHQLQLRAIMSDSVSQSSLRTFIRVQINYCKTHKKLQTGYFATCVARDRTFVNFCYLFFAPVTVNSCHRKLEKLEYKDQRQNFVMIRYTSQLKYNCLSDTLPLGLSVKRTEKAVV